MAVPLLALAGVSAGANILSNLFAPGQSKFTASDVRKMLTAARASGGQRIQSGVNQANRSAAAQAAQAGITDPGFLARTTGLNQQTGAAQLADLESNLAQTQIGAESELSGMNAQLGQRKASGVGESFGYLGDILGSFGTLQYLQNNPDLMSLLRGEGA